MDEKGYIMLLNEKGETIEMTKNYQIPPGAFDYIIYAEGNVVKAKNGRSGRIEFKGKAGVDDAEVIQSAADSLSEIGGTVFIKSGIYYIDQPIQVKGHGINITGEGWGKVSQIPNRKNGTYLVKNFDGDLLVYQGTSEEKLEGFAIRDIALLNQNEHTGRGIFIEHALNFEINRVMIWAMKGISLEIKDSGVHFIRNSRFVSQIPTGTDDYIVYENNSGDWQISGCDIGASNDERANINAAIRVSPYTATGMICGNKIFNANGLIIADGTVFVAGNVLNDPYSYAVSCWDNSVIVGNKIFESNVGSYNSSGILILVRGNNNVVVGNQIHDPNDLYGTAIKIESGKVLNVVVGNVIKGTVNGIQDLGADTIVKYNSGYVTENSGTATFSGDGTTTDFLVGDHGLVVTDPTRIIVKVTPISADAIAASPCAGYVDPADPTKIRVKFASPPASGTNNVQIIWEAQVV